MIIPCLLNPKNISVIFSPLKQLQVVQVIKIGKYGIETLAINKDTPNDTNLWKVCNNETLLSIY